MGLFDDLLGAATGGAPNAGAQGANDQGGLGGGLGGLLGGQAAPIVMALLSMLLSRGGSGGGGLSDLLGQLRGSGLGSQVDSWLSPNAPNAPVSGSQLEGALGGSDLLGNLARQLGMPQGDVASALSQVLPGVVDQLTPQGDVPADLPDASQVDLGQIVGRMLQGR